MYVLIFNICYWTFVHPMNNRKMPIIEQSVLLTLNFFFPIVVAVIFGQQKDAFTTTITEKLTYCFTKTL